MDGPCAGELQLGEACVADNPECNECFLPDGTFAEAFPEDVEMQFRTTLAFVPPEDPGFCNEANARVCNYYVEAQSCCCKEETMTFINCQFNFQFKDKYGVTDETCQQNCDNLPNGPGGAGGDGGGGGSSIIVVVILVCTLFLLTGLGYLYWRRVRVGDNEKESDSSIACGWFSRKDKERSFSRKDMERFSRKDKETHSQKTAKADDLSVTPYRHDEELGGYGHGAARTDPLTSRSSHNQRRNSKEFPTRSRSNSKEPIRSGSTSSRGNPRSNTASIPNDDSDPSSSESSDDDEETAFSTPTWGAGNKPKQLQKKQSPRAIGGRGPEDAKDIEMRLAMAERQAIKLRLDKKASTKKLKQLSEHGKQTEEELEFAYAEARMLEDKLVQKANKSDHNNELVHELNELEEDKWEMAEEIELLRQEKAELAQDLHISMHETKVMQSNFESAVATGAPPPPPSFIEVSDTMSVDDSTIAESFAPERHAPPSHRMDYHTEIPAWEEEDTNLRSSRHHGQRGSSNNGSEARSAHKSRSRSTDRRAIDPYSEGQSKTSDRRARSKERFLAEDQSKTSDRRARSKERFLAEEQSKTSDRRARSKERFLSQSQEQPVPRHRSDISNDGSNLERLSRNSDHVGRSRSKERFPERSLSRTNSSERLRHAKPMPKFESDRSDDGSSERLSRNSSHSAKKPLRRAKSNERLPGRTLPERTNSSDQIGRHSDRNPRIPERGMTRGMSDRGLLYSQPRSTEFIRSSERRVPERGLPRTTSERFPREEREIPHVRSIKRAKSGEKLRKAERY